MGNDRFRNPLRESTDRRLPRIAGPSSLVIFGVTGDLATRKLLPAIYDLTNRGLLPPGFALVGFGRRDWGHGEFRDIAKAAVQEHCRTPFDELVWEHLCSGFRFVPGEFGSGYACPRLAEPPHRRCPVPQHAIDRDPMRTGADTSRQATSEADV